jgi:hypothetical protein
MEDSGMSIKFEKFIDRKNKEHPPAIPIECILKGAQVTYLTSTLITG